MNNTHKAVQYVVITHHDEIFNTEEPWDNMHAFESREIRYRIVSTETGEILDDAQGYGYKSAQKAYAAYAYKHRDKKKDKEKQAQKKQIENWMKEHRAFTDTLDYYAFEIAKGAMAPEDKVNAKLVEELLAKFELSPDFTANELLTVWKKN